MTIGEDQKMDRMMKANDGYPNAVRISMLVRCCSSLRYLSWGLTIPPIKISGQVCTYLFIDVYLRCIGLFLEMSI